MEININRKFIIVSTLAIAVIAAVAVALWPGTTFVFSTDNNFIGTRPVSTHATSSQPEQQKNPDAATVAFANAFYAVNYNDYEAWLSALKGVCTEDGYAILTKSVAPAVWPEIERAKTITPTTAIAAEDTGLALEGASEIGGPWQIRTGRA